MICKKCGAYNPDHATFCKVCAANLKDQTDADEAVEAAEAEEVEQELRPRRGNLKTPDFLTARRAAFNAAPEKTEPAREPDNDAAEAEDEEDDVKPADKPSPFARPAAPVQKRRILDEEDEDEEDEDEDDYDEEEDVKPAGKKSFFSCAASAKKRPARDEDDEDEDEDEDAEKLESEPKTTRFTRPVGKKRRFDDDDEDDEDEDEDEDEEEGYDDDSYDDDDGDEDDEGDEDDGYEEYEPTPPRRKKSGRSQSKGSDGGFNIVTLLIVCLLAILLIIVGIVAFCNIKGGATKSKLPSFLQFNCAGKAVTDSDPQPKQQQPQTEATPSEPESSDPTEQQVTGTSVDYLATTMEEGVDSNGNPCIFVIMTARPGDVVTIETNQGEHRSSNDEPYDRSFKLTILKSLLYPDEPLTEAVYKVEPKISVTHTDGVKEYLNVDPFEVTFPAVPLTLTEPNPDTISEEGIMAPEGNKLLIKGNVGDHYVTVTVNDQPAHTPYLGGDFDYTYTLSGDEAERVTIVARKINCVTSTYSFLVRPYEFIPEKMELSVATDISKLRADKNQKVTVTGKTVPGTTLTATPDVEYQTAVLCGSPHVDAEGNFSFDVTFDKNYYGVASIILHAKKEGYEEGETSFMVYRMYADQKSAVTGYSKTKSYHEVYRGYSFESVMADPAANGLYRFSGKIVAVDPETGVVTFEALTSAKGKTNIYVLDACSNWSPDKKIGKSFLLYCTLNGLYTDDASLYVTAWFFKKA